MTTLTGADLVAKALADLGVRHVFAIVSIHNMPLLDAINRLGKTAIVDVRHEVPAPMPPTDMRERLENSVS